MVAAGILGAAIYEQWVSPMVTQMGKPEVTPRRIYQETETDRLRREFERQRYL
jgi:hypothetical protein